MNISFYLHDEKDSSLIEQKLLWLKKRFHFISANDIIEYLYDNKPLHNTCHITIDDGWLSTYKTIFPLLKKHNIPATIFVSPYISTTNDNFWYYKIKFLNHELFKKQLIAHGLFSDGILKYPLDLVLKELPITSILDEINYFIDENKIINIPNGFMNIEQIREMSDSGLVNVGAHTIIHPILASECNEKSQSEISDSITQLENLLQKEVFSFAYPNGLPGLDFTEREKGYLRQKGIKLAFSVAPGCINKNTDALDIPRVGSINRLKLGHLGLILPSLYNQKGQRNSIRKFKL